MSVTSEQQMPMLRVMALHALAYCERLFYFEEVEEIRVADSNVFAGRRLHEELSEEESKESHQIEDEELGLIGKLDAIRNRDGQVYPYEHKRGRSNKGDAWRSDRLQIGAYAMLLEKALARSVTEGRIRYHRDQKTVIVPISEEVRQEVRDAIQRANELREHTERPPIAENDRLCIACSLSPVCLPEESRQVDSDEHEAIRLFPPHRERRVVHVLGHGDRIGRKGDRFSIHTTSGESVEMPVEEVQDIVIHGYAQISTQAIGLCAYRDIAVHWLTAGGNYLCALTTGAGRVQRRIQQYRHLAEPEHCLLLAQRSVENRVENQLQFLMRLTRGKIHLREPVKPQLRQLRELKKKVPSVESVDSLRGLEGASGSAYFCALQQVLNSLLDEPFQFTKRTRRPPRDRFNAMLSFGYSLLQRAVLRAILTVGLEPALGYYHTPRSAAHPLALDLMDIFRTPIWDVALVASLRTRNWNPDSDFVITNKKVWLSDNGRKKAIEVFEKRLDETWKHPILGYSLSYARHIELEVRLLEKWWTEGKSLFATSSLR